MSEPLRRLVIGVGNPDRGDDGVGLLVARLLRDRLPADVRIATRGGNAAELLDLFQQADSVILVDAAVTGAPAGTVHQVDCALAAPPPTQGASSHGFGVAEAVGLARALGCLPARCVIYAIEAEQFAVGTEVGAPVAAAAVHVAAQIAAAF